MLWRILPKRLSGNVALPESGRGGRRPEMCLFCSMTRRQVFRGLTAAAVGVLAADASPGAAEAAEPVILGEGRYRYRVVEGWGALTPGFTYRDGAAVCVDSKDNVYVFNRG